MCGTERNRPRLSGRPDEPPYVSTVWEFWAKSVTVVTSPRKCQCRHTSCPLRAWRQERQNESFLSLSVLVPRLCFIPFQTWQSNMSGSCSKQHPVSFYLRQNPHAQDFCNRQHKIIKTLACCEVKHHRFRDFGGSHHTCPALWWFSSRHSSISCWWRSSFLFTPSFGCLASS